MVRLVVWLGELGWWGWLAVEGCSRRGEGAARSR